MQRWPRARMKEQMNGTHTATHTWLSAAKSGRRVYWSGFSVCLFIVLLSVFSWVVQRRLAQYESQQAGGHHMTATKVCLTERPQISVPSIQSVDGFALFFIAIAFTGGAFFRLDDSLSSPASHYSPPPLCRTRSKPCMAHFFFLPPPAIFAL